jgi:hypothetical protein
MQYHSNRRPARQPVKSDWVKKTGTIGPPDRSIVAPTTLSANGRYLRKAVGWSRRIPDITFAAMNVVVERQATRASQIPALRQLARAP